MKEWLVVDGYNVINSWQDFRKFREENLEHARELLKEKLAEYIAFKGYSGIVVFDAQEVQGVASFEKNGALEIVSRMKVKPLIHGLNDAYMILLRAEAVFLL